MKERTISANEAVGLMQAAFAAGKPFALAVTGTSMSPLLRDQRDAVFLVSPQMRPPKRNDILLFKRQDALILHRILSVKKDGAFVVNGDAQTWCERVQPEQALAVAEAILRKGKRIPCDSVGYRCLSACWRKTRLFRPLLHRMRLFFRPKTNEVC